jgi:hypothetical protein
MEFIIHTHIVSSIYKVRESAFVRALISSTEQSDSYPVRRCKRRILVQCKHTSTAHIFRSTQSSVFAVFFFFAREKTKTKKQSWLLPCTRYYVRTRI